MRARPVAICLALCLTLIGVFACDDATAPPDAGTVTLAPDQGVDFVNGRSQSPGNFSNSDLFATSNGDGIGLSTGGSSPVDNRFASWFRSGGIAPVFPSLASVPSSPVPTAYDAMVHARTGNGCIVVSKNGDLVRVFVAAASASSVTLQWERVVSE